MYDPERHTLRVLARLVNRHLRSRDGHALRPAPTMAASALEAFVAHGLVDQEPGGRAAWTKAGLELVTPGRTPAAPRSL